MWTVIKFEKKALNLLIKDLKAKVGEDIITYSPILEVQYYKKNKLSKKQINLMDNYFFCYHKKFEKKSFINAIKFAKGLKYFLDGYFFSQKEIKLFIDKCKESENEKGFLNQNFLELYKNFKYKFQSGPFVEQIFKILSFNKNRINILLGGVETSIKKDKFLISPV